MSNFSWISIDVVHPHSDFILFYSYSIHAKMSLLLAWFELLLPSMFIAFLGKTNSRSSCS